MHLDAYGRDLPISPELWERLRRADPHCTIWLVRTAPGTSSPWQRAKRVWVATIKPDGRQTFEHVQGVHPVFAEAVALAVAAAERKGWLRPAATAGSPDPGGCG